MTAKTVATVVAFGTVTAIELYNLWKNIDRARQEDKIGKFTRGRHLGGGAYGEVYVWKNGQKTYAGKQVALGNMAWRHDAEQETESLRQLSNEIAKISQLNHENIIEYIGTSSDEDHVYLFMELMECSIADRAKESPISETKARVYTRGIVDGLNYLHSNKIIHCDIKGQNVLLKDDVAKLADFGISQHYATEQSATATIHFQGTMHYMAPELWENFKPGKRADIWAVGCTIYEMLHQNPPFHELNMIQLQQKTVSRDQRDLVQASVVMSAELKEFLLLIFTPKDQRPDAKSLKSRPWLKKA